MEHKLYLTNVPSEISDTSELPREASIDRLIHIVEIVNDESKKKSELIEQLGANSDAIYDTVRLGTGLSFLHETEQGVTATRLGARLSTTEETQSSTIFKKGLKNHKTYCTILRSLDDKELIHEGPLERETVIKTLRRDFGLDLSTKTTKERVHTMFRTLEASGLGTFVSGNSTTITHFNFSEDYREILNTILYDKNGISESASDTSTNESQIERPQFHSNIKSSNEDYHVHLNFEIDNSVNPEDIEEFVFAIRRAMTRNIK